MSEGRRFALYLTSMAVLGLLLIISIQAVQGWRDQQAFNRNLLHTYQQAVEYLTAEVNAERGKTTNAEQDLASTLKALTLVKAKADEGQACLVALDRAGWHER